MERANRGPITDHIRHESRGLPTIRIVPRNSNRVPNTGLLLQEWQQYVNCVRGGFQSVRPRLRAQTPLILDRNVSGANMSRNRSGPMRLSE